MEDKLSSLLKNCPHLTELDLSYQNIAFSKVKLLATILENNTHLISLNLAGNNINNKGAIILSNMLKKKYNFTNIKFSK